MNVRQKNHFALNFGVAVASILSMIAFDVFNFASTEFALSDFLGDMEIWGLRWATLLAVAFCLIDIAGIAGIFTPEKGKNEKRVVKYLFIGWLISATLNAGLTWWGVGVSMINRGVTGNVLMSQEDLYTFVPRAIAILVWLTRISIISSIVFTFDNARLPAPKPLLRLEKAKNQPKEKDPLKDKLPTPTLTTFGVMNQNEAPGWGARNESFRPTPRWKDEQNRRS